MPSKSPRSQSVAGARPPRGFRARLGVLAFALIVAALAVGAICYFAAPWMAFRALRSAALADDVRTMSELMDVGAVRASLRAQLNGDEPGAAPSVLDDPLGALKAITGGRIGAAAPDVEGYLTTAAMTHLTHARPHQPGAPFRSGDLLPGLHDSTIRYWGPNRVRIAALAPGAGDAESLFTFERRGLFKWRLTQIRLPAAIGA